MGASSPTDQEHANSGALAAVREFLGGPHVGADGWEFEFGEHLESNWGNVYGGAIAAGMLAIARDVAPDQSPRSLHLQIVRTVPRGAAYATATMRHAGRTVGTVEVELYDHRRKLAAIALVTMVTPGALAAEYHDTAATPPFELEVQEVLPEWLSQPAPISDALRLTRRNDGGIVALQGVNVRPSIDGTLAGVMEATLPWTDLVCTGPEAACLAADAIVALPVMRSFIPVDAMGPNPDLTLRFTTAPATQVVSGAATLLSIQHGTATVGIEIQAGEHQLAHGLATSLLLGPR